ncbi:hypothetical protein CU098_001751, partial [Rhizopus stolonifer]
SKKEAYKRFISAYVLGSNQGLSDFVDVLLSRGIRINDQGLMQATRGNIIISSTSPVNFVTNIDQEEQ